MLQMINMHDPNQDNLTRHNHYIPDVIPPPSRDDPKGYPGGGGGLQQEYKGKLNNHYINLNIRVMRHI